MIDTDGLEEIGVSREVERTELVPIVLVVENVRVENSEVGTLDSVYVEDDACGENDGGTVTGAVLDRSEGVTPLVLIVSCVVLCVSDSVLLVRLVEVDSARLGEMYVGEVIGADVDFMLASSFIVVDIL